MTFNKGDIIAYTPSTLFRRDGYAEVRISWDTDEPYGQDTFDQNDTRLTADEIATGYVLFNLNDFIEKPFADEEAYDPEDVFVLDTRKGMAKRTFVRRGAQELPDDELIERHVKAREANTQRARALLLSPNEHQDLVASDLPEMTAEEVTVLADTLRWIQRATTAFETSLEHLVRIRTTGDGNADFQTVHTDEDHYELWRARRALDSRLSALRG